MIQLDHLGPGDAKRVHDIWLRDHAGHYDLPGMNNTLDNRLLLTNGELVGFGMVKLYAEGILVLDKTASKIRQVQAVKAAIDHALDITKKCGLEHLHILSDDPHYIEVLQKHWDFRTVPETLLRMEIE